MAVAPSWAPIPVRAGGTRASAPSGAQSSRSSGDVLLMDVAIEYGDVVSLAQQIDGARAVFRRPVPRGVEVEQRPVREHHEGHFGRNAGEVGGEPLELRVAQDPARLRDIVERDEMDSLVVERVPRLTEGLAVRIAVVEGRVVLARDETHRPSPLSADTISLKRANRVCTSTALIVATACSSVTSAWGLGGPLKPQCVSESCRKKRDLAGHFHASRALAGDGPGAGVAAEEEAPPHPTSPDAKTTPPIPISERKSRRFQSCFISLSSVSVSDRNGRRCVSFPVFGPAARDRD